MSRDGERMLAQGPRIAPEPRSTEAWEAIVGGLVVSDAAPGRERSPGRGLTIGRAVVPALFVALFVSTFVGDGSLSWVLLLGAIVAATLVGQRGRRSDGEAET